MNFWSSNKSQSPYPNHKAHSANESQIFFQIRNGVTKCICNAFVPLESTNHAPILGTLLLSPRGATNYITGTPGAHYHKFRAPKRKIELQKWNQKCNLQCACTLEIKEPSSKCPIYNYIDATWNRFNEWNVKSILGLRSWRW